MDILVHGMAHWIEASMADLARELGAERRGAAAPALDVELDLGPAWLSEDVWPAEPVWAQAPVWHTDVEDGQVVATTDDVVQLDRSSRLSAVRLDVA